MDRKQRYCMGYVFLIEGQILSADDLDIMEVLASSDVALPSLAACLASRADIQVVDHVSIPSTTCDLSVQSASCSRRAFEDNNGSLGCVTVQTEAWCSHSAAQERLQPQESAQQERHSVGQTAANASMPAVEPELLQEPLQWQHCQPHPRKRRTAWLTKAEPKAIRHQSERGTALPSGLRGSAAVCPQSSDKENGSVLLDASATPLRGEKNEPRLSSGADAESSQPSGEGTAPLDLPHSAVASGVELSDRAEEASLQLPVSAGYEQPAQSIRDLDWALAAAAESAAHDEDAHPSIAPVFDCGIPDSSRRADAVALPGHDGLVSICEQPCDPEEPFAFSNVFREHHARDELTKDEIRHLPKGGDCEAEREECQVSADPCKATAGAPLAHCSASCQLGRTRT